MGGWGRRGGLLGNPLSQRRRRTEFWEAKTTEHLKLKGFYKGERVGAMEDAGQLCLALGTSSCNSASHPAPGQKGCLLSSQENLRLS